MCLKVCDLNCDQLKLLKEKGMSNTAHTFSVLGEQD